MLSLLIPVYNYDILPLVKEIHQQAVACNITFEIIIIDDCSAQVLFDIDIIKSFSNTKLILLKHNIGRSATRNLLAGKAQYEHLLFIDAGTFPKSKTFVAHYLEHLEDDITIGGMVEEVLPPRKPFRLRWLYTKKRESFIRNGKHIYTSANFLIKKTILQSYPFDESITKYGFEDFIFFQNLKSNAFIINFIDNPVIHDSHEDATTFITKTEYGLSNLVQLAKHDNALLNGAKILNLQTKLQSAGLNKLIAFVFNLTKPLLIKNFNSSYPSILLFDFYKLGYLCHLKSNKK